MQDTQQSLLTVAQAAEKYNLPGITIYTAIKRDEIKAGRIGRLWLVYPDSLEYWLANRPKRGRPIK